MRFGGGVKRDAFVSQAGHSKRVISNLFLKRYLSEEPKSCPLLTTLSLTYRVSEQLKEKKIISETAVSRTFYDCCCVKLWIPLTLNDHQLDYMADGEGSPTHFQTCENGSQESCNGGTCCEHCTIQTYVINYKQLHAI